MSDDFVEKWRNELSDSLTGVARLAPQAQDIDFASGLLATGVLWPVRAAVQEYDGEAIDAIRAIAGVNTKHVLRAVQEWDGDHLAAARSISAAARENPALAEALAAIVAHFDAAKLLSTRLGNMPPEVVKHIQAGLVNLGGNINIHQLTLNMAHAVEIPPPPRPDRPPEVDRFVGRSQELGYYGKMLVKHHQAIISGMAGVGKTALAAALARQSSPLDLIFWHGFRAGEGIEVIIWKLAAFLAWHGQDELWRMLQSARQTGAQAPPPETLFDYLLPMVEGRAYLLCFDDLHLVEDDPLLIRLVERLRAALVAGRLSVIFTSRHVPAFVQSLKVETLSGLRAEDAHLLLERWEVSLPETLFDRLYSLTGGNAQFMTLALNVLHHEAEPGRAIERLAESDNIERYLLAEVEGRLNEQEQAVMGAVAVLLGYPASQDAIEAVLDGDGVRRTLRQLADRHLLIVREGAHDREYQQHAIVQAFYYDLLSRAKRRAMHLAAAAFYEQEETDLLRAAIHYERGGDFGRSAQVATRDLWALINQGQIRALRHLLEQFTLAQLERAEWINVNLALGQICQLLAEGRQARTHYQEVLDQLTWMDASLEVAKVRIHALRGLGQLVYNEEPQEALEWLQRAFDEVARLDGQVDAQTEAALYLDMGWAHRRLHNVAAAMEALQHGLKRLPRRPSPLRGDALTRLVALYVAQFDLENAQRYAQMAVENSRHLPDVWHQQSVLVMLGNLKHMTCDWQGAIPEYEGALAIALEIGDRTAHAAMEVNLGIAHTNLGNTQPALAHLRRGIELSHQSHLRNHELKAQLALARLYMRLGECADVERHLDAAEALVEKAGTADARFHLPLILSARAEQHFVLDKLDEALALAEESVTLAVEQEKQVDRAVCQRVMAQILVARGEVRRAAELLEESLPLLAGRHGYEAAKIKALLGHCLVKRGETIRGEALLHEARLSFETYGAKFDLAEVTPLQS